MRVRDTGKLLHSWFGNAIGILGLSVEVLEARGSAKPTLRPRRRVVRFHARLTSSDRTMIDGLRKHYTGATDTDVVRHSLRLAYFLATGKTLDDSPISINAEAVGIEVEVPLDETEQLPSLEREIKDRTFRMDNGPETFPLFPDDVPQSHLLNQEVEVSAIPAGVI